MNNKLIGFGHEDLICMALLHSHRFTLGTRMLVTNPLLESRYFRYITLFSFLLFLLLVISSISMVRSGICYNVKPVTLSVSIPISTYANIVTVCAWMCVWLPSDICSNRKLHCLQREKTPI